MSRLKGLRGKKEAAEGTVASPSSTPSASCGGGGGGGGRPASVPSLPMSSGESGEAGVSYQQGEGLSQCSVEAEPVGATSGDNSRPFPTREEERGSPMSLRDLERKLVDGMRDQLAVFWERMELRLSRPSLGAPAAASAVRGDSTGAVTRKKGGSTLGGRKKATPPGASAARIPSPPQEEEMGEKKKRKRKGKEKGGDSAGGGPATQVPGAVTPDRRPLTQQPPHPPSPLSLPPTGSQEVWSQVVRKRKGKGKGRGEPALTPTPQPSGKGGKAAANRGGKQPPPPKLKVGKSPRNAGITLSPVAPDVKMGELMAQIRGKIKLDDYGVQFVRPKRAVTGAFIIEVPGDDCEAKADKLCAAMAPLAEAGGARVARPVKTAELRIRGLDDSISPEELKEAVAAAGGCRPTDVKVGRARASPGVLISAWVQCPITAARKLAGARTIPVGWVRATVEVLERRPLQCHRCLRRRPVMATCPYTAPTEDRRGRCYR